MINIYFGERSSETTSQNRKLAADPVFAVFFKQPVIECGPIAPGGRSSDPSLESLAGRAAIVRRFVDRSKLSSPMHEERAGPGEVTGPFETPRVRGQPGQGREGAVPCGLFDQFTGAPRRARSCEGREGVIPTDRVPACFEQHCPLAMSPEAVRRRMH